MNHFLKSYHLEEIMHQFNFAKEAAKRKKRGNALKAVYKQQLGSLAKAQGRRRIFPEEAGGALGGMVMSETAFSMLRGEIARRVWGNPRQLAFLNALSPALRRVSAVGGLFGGAELGRRIRIKRLRSQRRRRSLINTGTKKIKGII